MSPEAKPSALAGQIESAVRNCCGILETRWGLKPERLFLLATEARGITFLSILFFSRVSKYTSHDGAWLEGWASMLNTLRDEKVEPALAIEHCERDIDRYWENRQLSARMAGIKIIRAKEVTL